jgi:hypothetical protein
MPLPCAHPAARTKIGLGWLRGKEELTASYKWRDIMEGGQTSPLLRILATFTFPR